MQHLPGRTGVARPPAREGRCHTSLNCHCRPRASALRSLNLSGSFAAVGSLTLLSLADPEQSCGELETGR
jgi:hypothetical protein